MQVLDLQSWLYDTKLCKPKPTIEREKLQTITQTVSLWTWSDDIVFTLNFMRTISLRCRWGSQIWKYTKTILRKYHLTSMSLISNSSLLQSCCYMCQFSFEKFKYVCKFSVNQESSLKKNSLYYLKCASNEYNIFDSQLQQRTYSLF